MLPIFKQNANFILFFLNFSGTNPILYIFMPYKSFFEAFRLLHWCQIYKRKDKNRVFCDKLLITYGPEMRDMQFKWRNFLFSLGVFGASYFL